MRLPGRHRPQGSAGTVPSWYALGGRADALVDDGYGKCVRYFGLGVICPPFRQIQSPIQEDPSARSGVRQEHAELAVPNPAHQSGMLPLHADETAKIAAATMASAARAGRTASRHRVIGTTLVYGLPHLPLIGPLIGPLPPPVPPLRYSPPRRNHTQMSARARCTGLSRMSARRS